MNLWKFSPSEKSRRPSVSGARLYSDVLGQAPISAASLHKLHKRLTRSAERLEREGEGEEKEEEEEEEEEEEGEEEEEEEEEGEEEEGEGEGEEEEGEEGEEERGRRGSSIGKEGREGG